MKKLTTAILLGLCTTLHAGILLTPNQPSSGCSLAWDPSPSSVSGYYLYYGTTNRQYTAKVDAGPTTTFTLTNLARGVTYYITATAYALEAGTTNRVESDYCNEVVYRATELPSPPTNLKGSNAVLMVSIERAIRPSGPWDEFGDLWTSPETGYFRAKLSMLRNPDALVAAQKVEEAIANIRRARVPSNFDPLDESTYKYQFPPIPAK